MLNWIWDVFLLPLLELGTSCETFFLRAANMGITASYVILLVLLIRLLLKKAPKIYSYVLWFAVLFRLLCPVALPSPVSFLNLLRLKGNQTVMEYIPMNIGMQGQPTVNYGIPALSQAISRVLPAGNPAASMNPLQALIPICAALWLLGIAGFAVYVLLSGKRLRQITRTAAETDINIYECEGLATPFACGLFSKGLFGSAFLRARIYLPAHLKEEERQIVLAHERTHLRRLDPLIKGLFFAALAIHWYHPLVWAAFFTMIRDMEMSCDEAVLEQISGGLYSETLLRMALEEAGLKKVSSFGPLAFGESSVAARIKNVLRYRKVSFRTKMLLCVFCAAFLFASACNPASGRTSLMTRLDYYVRVLTRGTEDTTDILWENKTPYLGDNSAVGALLGALTVPAELGIASDGMELMTSERPYCLTIRYLAESDTARERFLSSYLPFYTRGTGSGIDPGTDTDAGLFAENAAVLFGLIENVDVIVTRITFNDGDVYEYAVSRGEAALALYGDTRNDMILSAKRDLEDHLEMAWNVGGKIGSWYSAGLPFELSAMTVRVVSCDRASGILLAETVSASGPDEADSSRFYMDINTCQIVNEKGNALVRSDIKAGDLLYAAYDGMILETSPAQIPGVLYIQRIAED